MISSPSSSSPPPGARPIRVAFVFIGMPVGGAEDFAIGAARRLSADFAPLFVCLRELGPLGAEARSSGLRVELVPASPSKQTNPVGFFRLAAWLRREGVDIVHSQTHHAHLFCAAASFLCRIPFVLHQQKTLADLPPRKQFIFRWCIRRASAIVALSERTRDDIATRFHCPPSRLHVVPNAIDDSVFFPAASEEKAALRQHLGLPVDRLLFATVASLHPVKNHALILRALRDWPADVRRPLAVFVGEGAARDELVALANSSGLRDDVLFAGRQRPVAPWMRAMDAFLLPSHWEGQPLAMLQALACGLPVLGSAIEGNLAVLGASHPALFPPDAPEALRDILLHAATDPSFLPGIQSAQARIRVPTCAAAAAGLAQIYRSLLAPWHR